MRISIVSVCVFVFLQCEGAHLIPYLNVVVSVVVKVEDPVDLGVASDHEILDGLDALLHRLSRVLLHLYVVELPEKERIKTNALRSSTRLGFTARRAA